MSGRRIQRHMLGNVFIQRLQTFFLLLSRFLFLFERFFLHLWLAMHSVVLAIADLSVCPSVTCWCLVQRNEHTIMGLQCRVLYPIKEQN